MEQVNLPTVTIDPADRLCDEELLMQRSRPPLVHTVSIVIEPVDPGTEDEPEEDEAPDIPPTVGTVNTKEDLVKSLMDTARLRKEEFARLLEEHAQLVKEINRAENSLM